MFLKRALSAVERLRRERGVALIAVLAFLSVMSLIVAGVVGSARTVATGASRELLRAQAQAAVESGIDYAIGELVNAKGFAPPLVSKPETVEIGGFRVAVSARSEYAKVDINFADNNLLTILFRAGGANSEQAAALADAVEDWRDGDDLVHVNGAERRQYEDAGLSYGPANKFFTNPDELRLVLGMNQRLYDCVRPQVTVLSQRQGIDIDHAVPAIRAAAGAQSAPLAPQQIITAGEPFEITARLDDSKRGVSRAERAVVRLTGNPGEPYWVLGAEPAHPLDEAASRACPKAASQD